MQPVSFPLQNAVLGAPRNSPVPCSSLPVYTDGTHFVSAWQPSADELAALNRGEVLYLMIHGFQPMVSLTVECPIAVQPQANQV